MGEVIADEAELDDAAPHESRHLDEAVRNKQGDDDVSKKLKFAVLAVALTAGVAIGPVAYADATHPSGSPEGTAPQGGMMGSGTMPGGDMMGMMTMMTQMSQMAETCNKMMQSAMQSPTQPQQSPGEQGAPPPQKQGG